jgi:hypothetical protein
MKLPSLAIVCALAIADGALAAGPARVDGDDEETAGPAGDEGEGDEIDVPAAAHGRISLVDEAERELGARREIKYTHKTVVDERRGVFDFDCSGFVSYALARSDADAYRAVHDLAHKRPLARHYVELFEGLDGKTGAWAPVRRVEDLRPGDVVAWLKPADVVTRNTGHVMIVAARPRRDARGWRVPIVDSTAAPHGKGDARKQTGESGLGTGTIVLDVDDAGAPVAYHWSTWSKSKAHTTTIAMARPRRP